MAEQKRNASYSAPLDERSTAAGGIHPTALTVGKARWSLRRAVRRNGALLSMATPGLLLLVFSYLPMFGLIIAFKDYRAYQGVLGSAWVGLQNFQFLFGRWCAPLGR